MVEDTFKNCVAGGASSALWVCVFNPIDCLRIRWQTQQKGGVLTLTSFLRQILRTEGLWRGLWQPGCVANGSAIFISSGTRIGFYPLVRDRMMNGGKKKPSHMFFSGLALGSFGYWLSSPFYQAKTRLQGQLGRELVVPGGSGMRLPPALLFTDTWDFFQKTFASDGIRGLYRGATPLLVRGGLFSSGQFLGYDAAKDAAKSTRVLSDGPVLHFIGGISAAFLAVTFATPADYTMNKYMTLRDLGGRADQGVLGFIRDELGNRGMLSFYRGWTPFFARVGPIMCFTMPTYEQFRLILGLGYLD